MAARSRRARRTRRFGRLLGLAAIPIAVIGTGALVMGSSYSVFSATTSNPTNNWSAGSVTLADDDSNTAMFTVSNMAPGSSTGTKCIAVTSTGSLPSTVKLYGTGYTTTNALATYIDFTVTQGTGTSATGGSCTGFTALASNSAVYSGTLAGFGTSTTSFASGVPSTGAWTPTGSASETRLYKFVYNFQSAAPSSTQNGSASIGLTWEAQNN